MQTSRCQCLIDCKSNINSYNNNNNNNNNDDYNNNNNNDNNNSNNNNNDNNDNNNNNDDDAILGVRLWLETLRDHRISGFQIAIAPPKIS